ncbi:hypothetical protein GCM10011273_07590 [Asticcacaulis endophyticus]|uniref:Gylcosyl hydrolase 115 C-terminal domain-containing protein n=1 Tax=Asticcacaulis endophyticus TaxID=1395890 RepID=A0A918PX32_9CAUL|nr:hypothetical protein GCM10011273_07590 [Asticcacaulis endophyticus]
MLFDTQIRPAVIHDKDIPLTHAAELLGRDLEGLTGTAPKLSGDLKACGTVCIVITTLDSPLSKRLVKQGTIDLSALSGQWERYGRAVITTPDQTIVLISGSDTRGAVWGVMDLTRELGVSPWEWWADVTPRRVDRLTLKSGSILSDAPTVKYRGIFLNDEDWGLQPWAAKTFETNTKDIGPKTYAKIFELMWRLKANTIWPAMHDSTKPFYQIKGNPEMARDYAIVVGTSHAEPMMRNNVREWDKAKNGDFNFFTNPERMISYWRERVQEVKGFENIYSVGVRGVHDSAMEGAETPEQARDAVAEVIGIQRDLLARAQKKPAIQIPQALTLYKEVLDVYKAGLNVPDDITLVWPDDNYGYIHQLSTPDEAKRSGGAGVYYHISYWGRPHDYLWLGTTHPALIREQMQRAHVTGAHDIWIVNVGDIKPAEYLTQYFLDLAFDAKAFDATPRDHLMAWSAQQFGADQAAEITDILTDYYDLAWERRPEFMGWSQTEPTTPTRQSDYIGSDGSEAQARIGAYAALTARSEAVAAKLPEDRQPAFFELALYPVRSAANLNARILKLDLAAFYARQSRATVANSLSAEARAAHDGIVADAETYNTQLGGKWRHMMDMAPRRLPVFNAPAFPVYAAANPTTDKPLPKPVAPVAITYNTEVAKVVTIPAAFTTSPDWQIVPGLGSLGQSLRARLDLKPQGFTTATPATYRFDTRTDGTATLKIIALPVHALTSQSGVKVAVSIDDQPPVILDFETVGRSDEWKQNVLSNNAVRELTGLKLKPGRHTLKLYALDPGVIIDRFEVRFDGARARYGAVK